MKEGRPIEVGDEDFEREALKSDLPVLADLWVAWCGPCRTAAPVLERIAEMRQGRLKVCKLSVNQGREIAIGYHVTGIPTLGVFKDGERVDQIIVVTPTCESDIKKKIEPQLEVDGG